jgi:hypothetical protein
MEMLIHAFSNEASAKDRFLNLGANPNLTKTKVSSLDLKPIRHIQNRIQMGSDPGIFSQLVSSFMHVTKCRVYFSVILRKKRIKR